MAAIFARLSALVLFLVASVASAFEQTVYYQNDAFGSPVVATDVSGNVLWKETYQPFGSRTRNQDQGTNNIWFHTKPVDDETGLSYFGARYYDPAVGRFMGIDPAGFDESNVQSFNKYAYGNNNPFRYRDRDGNSLLDAGFLIYDVGKLAVTIYQGGDVGSALIDVGLSTAGVIIPIPLVGEGLKAARTAERLAVAAARAERSTEVAREAAHAESIGSQLAEEVGAAQGFKSFSAFKDAMGAAGPGMNWHHIVEQTPGNVTQFGAESIHNTQNLVRVDVVVHRRISAYYSSIQPFTGGQTVRNWLSAQSFKAQEAFGQRVLKEFEAEP